VEISDNALNVLVAKSFRGIGRAWVVKHLKGQETANRMVALLNDHGKGTTAITHKEFESAREGIWNSVSESAGTIDGVVGIGDAEFPPFRGAVKNSERPVVLFYRGDLELLKMENRNVAVIGLLHPDRDTEIVEAVVVRRLMALGATIVSGLALGCDTVAHKEALLCGGKTVAILPSPLDDILPAANRRLAEEIAGGNGLLITEYHESANSRMELSGRYQERDRLQALFSDCVVLTASYARNDLGHDSGSRLAMEYARSYSIRRAVMYDPELDAANPKYDLNRQLLAADDGVLIINRKNLESTAKDIVRQHAHAPCEAGVQPDLFG